MPTTANQARVIYTGTKLYICTTPDRGKTISRVHVFDVPEEAVISYYGRNTHLGPWTWSSCGCSSNWYNYTPEYLIALAETPDSPETAE